MSLILEGINLPDKGDVICLEIYSDGSVWDRSNWEPHPPKVSAIQIPKSHGNIIDESKAVVVETIDGYYEVTAPTILEKEIQEGGTA